jgi:hypothetical protein
MRNTWKTKHLNERPAGRTLLALSLAASLAAFGCTTNRTPGNGDPVVNRPGVGPAPPSSGVTGGSSGSPTSYQPMFSSSTYIEALPSVRSRASRLPLSPDEAAAIMAGNQFNRSVRVLGPVSPGPSTAVTNGGTTIATGQFQNPAMALSPILTVNSSINSAAHLPAISEGAGGGGGGAVITGAVTSNAIIAGGTTPTTTGAGLATGTTVTGASAGTVTTTGAAPGTGAAVFSPSTAAVTPTTAAPAFSPGSFAAGPGTAAGVVPGVATSTNNTGTLTPTVSSAGVATPTVSTSPVANTVSPTTRAATANATRTGTLRTVRNTTTTRAAGTASGSATAAVAPISVRTDANGKVIITNTTSGRQQK